jgi:NRPS condensation-like uncharacterized protein
VGHDAAVGTAEQQVAQEIAERALSWMEMGVWKMDQAAPLNFTTVARVRGPLDEGALRAGLAAVRARHPHLRARIVAGEDGWPWFRPCDAEIPVRVVSEVDWTAEVEREINEPLPAATGPLVRCVFIRSGPNEAYVLVTFHHSIGDGMSGAFLMRDLLTAASGSTALVPLHDTAEARLPPRGRGVRALWARLRFVARELALTIRYGQPLRLRRDRDAFCYQRRTRLIAEVLDEELSARLISRARAEGTTVHGALSAATILAMLADAGKRRARVSFGSPVNVRAELEPSVADDVGFYVSMVGYGAGVRADTELWQLARDVRRRLTRDIERGFTTSVFGLLVAAFKLLGGKRLVPRALARRWERRIQTTSGLTNLGRVDIPLDYGALSLEALHFAVCPSGLGDFATTATSLRGRIFWNFLWPDPVLDEHHATDLVAAIVKRLRDAIADEATAPGYQQLPAMDSAPIGKSKVHCGK